MIKRKTHFFVLFYEMYLTKLHHTQCFEGNRFKRWKWTVSIKRYSTHHRGNRVKTVGCWAKANRAMPLYTASVSGQLSTNKTNTVICSIPCPEVTSLSGEHNHSRPLIFSAGALGIFHACVCQNRAAQWWV